MRGGARNMETSSSLFACDRVKTRASGAFNFRSFSESTMHFQHSCSGETHGAPTQKIANYGGVTATTGLVLENGL